MSGDADGGERRTGRDHDDGVVPDVGQAPQPPDQADATDDHCAPGQGEAPSPPSQDADAPPTRMPGAPAQVGPSVPADTNDPVTVVISRLVRPGSEQAYDQWLHEAARLLSTHDGFEGMTALPPGQHHSGPEHVLVLRFRDYESMRRWKRSEARRRWISQLSDLTVDVGAWQEQSGLETWFLLDDRATPTGPPPRWKQAILTFVGLIPLLILMDLTAGRWLSDLPVWVRIPATTAVVVVAMAWLVMPAITRLVWRWLYPGQDD
ncbi:MAG: antibiotic biosynthesis monooxygenase [Nitriliruptoraceae bacterium]